VLASVEVPSADPRPDPPSRRCPLRHPACPGLAAGPKRRHRADPGTRSLRRLEENIAAGPSNEDLPVAQNVVATQNRARSVIALFTAGKPAIL